mgnify:CR=1 FL=1
MPRYDYFCNECEELYTLAHSWKEKVENCPKCESGLFSRVMNIANFLKQGGAKKQPAGSVVNQSIESAKKDLKSEKKTLGDRKK